MTQAKRIVSDVAFAARGHWPDVLERLGIKVPIRKQHGPCPICGGKDRFRFDDKEERGTWICNQCGAGDGLALVSKVTGKTIKEAAELVAPLVDLSMKGLVPAERERIHQQQRAEAECERVAQQRQKAACRATSIMANCEQGQSPYLAQKALLGLAVPLTRHIFPMGKLIFQPGALVVPLWDEAGTLVNVQLIDPQGVKRYLAGGQKAGTFHRIEGGDLIVVVEGYATGLSVHLATGATVYCAMDCSNLAVVAAIARRQHPKAQILLCGDNDAHTQGNPGKTKAEQAATAVDGQVSLPPAAGDWNDYHQAHGLTTTKKAIMSACTALPPLLHEDTSQKDEAPLQVEVAPLQSMCDGKTVEGKVLPQGFEIRGDRLCALMLVGRGEHAREESVPLSSPVWVLAETSDVHGQGYGRLLEWQDSAGQARQWAMPVRALVPRNGEAVFTALLDAGLPFIELRQKSKLAAYLMCCKPERRITCVERTGWHGSTYVLPHGSIGPGAEGVILQSAGFAANDFAERGTLVKWQQGVSALAVGNSRLCFALALAFAAPLLSLVGMEGGGFHLKGESTDGKTTVMKAAASVYGHPDSYAQTWRATGNAIEGIASRRNDALLCLDELGELDGREAGQTAYMLANGQGKGRSKQDGELRERKAWRLLFLSTGELSLEDHAASAGKSTQAGMEVRTIQIPSNTGQHGAFECLHGMEDGRTFADTLKANTMGQHGTAFRTFVEALAVELDQHRAQLIAEIKRLIEVLTPTGAGNQVGRAINRFALVAAAGELATRLGITGWPEGEATKAVEVCLKAWLSERGHLGNKEDAATLAQVRGFVTSNQYSRFADWFDSSHRPANMVGYRKVEKDCVSFFVLPPGWAEITKGRDPKRAAHLTLEAGYLLPSNDKKRLQRQARLPGMSKPVWVYVLTERVLADEVGEQEGE